MIFLYLHFFLLLNMMSIGMRFVGEEGEKYRETCETAIPHPGSNSGYWHVGLYTWANI